MEIATSFSKDEALSDFAHVQKQHASLLGSYDPMVVENCDLHMGTDVAIFGPHRHGQPRGRRQLCAKLQAAGGACIVQKN